jgi:hypothetical protein
VRAASLPQLLRDQPLERLERGIGAAVGFLRRQVILGDVEPRLALDGDNGSGFGGLWSSLAGGGGADFVSSGASGRSETLSRFLRAMATIAGTSSATAFRFRGGHL